MTDQGLKLLQTWMTSVITERGGLNDKLQSAAVRHGLLIEDVVVETAELSAQKRLGIYTNGYVLRLLECMRADFPALRTFVGNAVFDAFARAYIIGEPPKSPSLYDLSAGFPRFLQETKPDHGFLEPEITVLLDLPPEIARIERARAEVMRAPGIENDSPSTDTFLTFGMFTEALLLQVTPCLRLLDLKFPLVEFLKKLDHGDRPDPPAPQTSYVAIGRSNYRIHTQEIASWQFAFLNACQLPVSLNSAVQRTAEQGGHEPASLFADLMVWLPIAIELGYLRNVS
jgi:hypothetical protein